MHCELLILIISIIHSQSNLFRLTHIELILADIKQFIMVVIQFCDIITRSGGQLNKNHINLYSLWYDIVNLKFLNAHTLQMFIFIFYGDREGNIYLRCSLAMLSSLISGTRCTEFVNSIITRVISLWVID